MNTVVYLDFYKNTQLIKQNNNKYKALQAEVLVKEREIANCEILLEQFWADGKIHTPAGQALQIKMQRAGTALLILITQMDDLAKRMANTPLEGV